VRHYSAYFMILSASSAILPLFLNFLAV
jgi:hypothetical protein